MTPKRYPFTAQGFNYASLQRTSGTYEGWLLTARLLITHVIETEREIFKGKDLPKACTGSEG